MMEKESKLIDPNTGLPFKIDPVSGAHVIAEEKQRGPKVSEPEQEPGQKIYWGKKNVYYFEGAEVFRGFTVTNINKTDDGSDSVVFLQKEVQNPATGAKEIIVKSVMLSDLVAMQKRGKELDESKDVLLIKQERTVTVEPDVSKEVVPIEQVEVIDGGEPESAPTKPTAEGSEETGKIKKLQASLEKTSTKRKTGKGILALGAIAAAAAIGYQAGKESEIPQKKDLITTMSDAFDAPAGLEEQGISIPPVSAATKSEVERELESVIEKSPAKEVQQATESSGTIEDRLAAELARYEFGAYEASAQPDGKGGYYVTVRAKNKLAQPVTFYTNDKYPLRLQLEGAVLSLAYPGKQEMQLENASRSPEVQAYLDEHRITLRGNRIEIPGEETVVLTDVAEIMFLRSDDTLIIRLRNHNGTYDRIIVKSGKLERIQREMEVEYEDVNQTAEDQTNSPSSSSTPQILE